MVPSPCTHSRKEFRDNAAVTYVTKAQVRANFVKSEQDAEGEHGKYANKLQHGSNRSMVVSGVYKTDKTSFKLHHESKSP